MKRKTYSRYRQILDFIVKIRVPFLSSFIVKKIYDQHFFEDANQLKIKTAEQVASVVNTFFDFRTVFDIGCGMGLYINELFKTGKVVMGCDYSADAIKMSCKDFLIFQADISKPIILNQRFDLVMCFEVAEHIHQIYSKQLVSNCTEYSDRVIFTAVPIGQGGVGHINEQPYEFWINLFEQRSFAYNQTLSEDIRKKLRDNNVVDWLSNNFMCFERISNN